MIFVLLLALINFFVYLPDLVLRKMIIVQQELRQFH